MLEMQRDIRILVVTGNQIIPRKLESKLASLLALDQVQKVYLVTNGRYPHPKVRTFSPPGKWLFTPWLAHVWKAMTVLFILVRYSPDMVVTLGLIPHGIYTIVLATFFKRKKVYLSMGMNELIYSEGDWPGRVLRKIAFLSDLIGTRGTHSVAQLVRGGFDEDRIFIPHNVFDFEAFKPAVCEKIYDLIYVGLLEPYKRVDLLIEVVRRLVSEKGLKDIRLAVVGSGRLKEGLECQSRAKGVYGYIDFIPSGGADHVCRLLNQSKVFVMTSQGEGLPMAMIEAMSCGLPVVAFDHADIRDVARHEYNALLCPVGDVGCFVAAIEALVKNVPARAELSRNALEIRVQRKEEYSPESIQNVWLKALANLQWTCSD